MDQITLENALKGLPLGMVRYAPSLPSTNDEAARLVRADCPDLTLVVADQQTAGRGRQGRVWITQPGASLAFSIVLLPPFPLENEALPRLTALGALAVVDALNDLPGIKAEIKWPNDVLLNHKKTAGILAEAQWSGDRAASVVLGIGVNVTATSIPNLPTDPGLVPPPFVATCIEAELGLPVDRLALLRKIVENLLFWRPKAGSPEFLEAWDQALAFRGEWVRVFVLGFPSLVEYDGKIVGLATDGSLRLKTPDGEEVNVIAGEVQLRP
jgi:BirA family transcriptional regulator, biotin operon repressor / biotin---[acetyl-CoA-carboxylase] ligase